MAARTQVSNPKLRLTGAVLLGLAVLCYLGTVTGLDAHGGGGRVVLAVVGTLLVLPGIALVRTRVPRVTTLRADGQGITVGLRGRAPFTIPWHDVEAVWLRRLDPVMGGHLLCLQLSPTSPGAASLRAFEQPQADGTTVALVGLDAAQGRTLLAQLPAGGQRYRGVVVGLHQPPVS